MNEEESMFYANIDTMNYLGAEPARYLVCAKLYFKIKL